MKNRKAHSTTILDTPPSCIAFLPTTAGTTAAAAAASSQPWWFVVGTYRLHHERSTHVELDGDGGQECSERQGQDRTGGLCLFRLDGLNNLPALACKVDTPYAILDLRFDPGDGTRFAVATSVGSIVLWQVQINPNDSTAALHMIRSFQVSDPSILVLSCEWQPKHRGKMGEPCVAVSLSDGKVGILEISDASHTLRLVQAHSLEAWIVHWSHGDIFSGSDDARICRHDLLLPQPDSQDPASYHPLAQDRRIHQAGVTAILEHQSSNIILTGSYDEYLRILSYDTKRNRFVELAKKSLGGGVWRLAIIPDAHEKLHSDTINDIVEINVLASCMHAGVRVVKLRRDINGSWAIEVTNEFTEHESMNYASAIAGPVGPNHGANDAATETVILSTSFYDRRLCVWSALI